MKANERKKYCDFLWALLIKARAGFQSELSGKLDSLHSHHLRGKAGYSLRYNLDNGICLTSGEHLYMAHNTSRQFQFENMVKQLRGKDIFERLEKIKNGTGKKLTEYEADLTNELRPYAEKIKEYYEAKNYKTKQIKTFYNKLLEEICQ
ncbi:MAG: hypothetical protein D6707_10400 [Bacteroidetes bacterium]|nr:MAG: hypothetical protein D6707_10400 [Bacteroidota bacterium]